MSRLPTPGGDDGTWAGILNDFLGVSLNGDGTLKGTSVSSAGGALDSAVVHTTASETIGGTKTFTSPPSVPAPVGPTDAANKSYADNAYVTKGSLVYNVKDYSAVGDGTTDDTNAIKSAITAAAATGGVIFFPPGTYRETSEVTCTHSNISFVGSGAGATIIRQDTFDDAALYISAADCSVSGITFLSTQPQRNVSGGGVAGATNHPCGVYASYATGLTVSDCDFINFVKGVQFNRGSGNVYLQNCGNTLRDCGFSSNAWDLVCLQQSHCTVRGMHPCVATNCTQTLSPGTVTITPTTMANIYPNSTVQIDDGAYQEQVVVLSTTATAFTAAVNFSHDGSSVPFKVAACYVNSQGANPPHQIYFSGAYNQRSSDVSISECTCRNNPWGAQFALKYVDRLMVENCSAYNCTRSIEIERCTYALASNCVHSVAQNMGFEYSWNAATAAAGDTRQTSLSVTDSQWITVSGCRFDTASPWYDVLDNTDTTVAGSGTTFSITQSCASIGLIAGSLVLIDINSYAEQCTVTSASGSSFTVSATIKGHAAPFPIFLPGASTTDTTDSNTAIGSVTLTPGSMSGICPGTTLRLGATTDFEEVVATAVTSTTFTTTCTKTHSAPFPITGLGFSDGNIPVAVEGYDSSNDGGCGSSNVRISNCAVRTYFSSTPHAGGGGISTSAAFLVAGSSYVTLSGNEWHQSGDFTNGSGHSYYGYYIIPFAENTGYSYGTSYATASTGSATYASGSAATIPVASLAGIAAGGYVLIDSGSGAQELQKVASVNAPGLTLTTNANLAYSHTAPFAVQAGIPQGNINVLSPVVWNATSLAQIGTLSTGSLLTNVNFDLNSDLLMPISTSTWTTNSFKSYAGSGCRMQVRTSGLPNSLSGTTPFVGFAQNFKTNNNGVVYQLSGIGASENTRTISIRSNDSTTIIPNSVGNAGIWSGGNIILLSGVNTTNASTTSASGATALNCASVTNMVPGMKLLLDPATANQEVVTVGSVNFVTSVVTTTANLTKSHSSGAIIVNCWQASNNSATGLGNSITFQFDTNNWRQIGGGN